MESLTRLDLSGLNDCIIESYIRFYSPGNKIDADYDISVITNILSSNSLLTEIILVSLLRVHQHYATYCLC